MTNKFIQEYKISFIGNKLINALPCSWTGNTLDQKHFVYHNHLY